MRIYRIGPLSAARSETRVVDPIGWKLGHGTLSPHEHLPESIGGRCLLGKFDGKAAYCDCIRLVTVDFWSHRVVLGGRHAGAVVRLSDTALTT